MKINRYGWVADLPVHRNHIFAAPMQVGTSLPPKADLRQQGPPLYDQGQLDSCFAAVTKVTMGDYPGGGRICTARMR